MPAHGHLVYRFEPRARRLSVVASDFDKPNGLAFSPDERVLYVGDSGANHEPGSFDPSRPHTSGPSTSSTTGSSTTACFAVTTPGFPDGIKVAPDGRVLASAFNGVEVFDPRGELLDELPVPGAVNFTFGGDDGETLFITPDTAVWAAEGA